jgi:hypothetical protein
MIATGKQGNGEASNIGDAKLRLPQLQEFLATPPH